MVGEIDSEEEFVECVGCLVIGKEGEKFEFC